MNRLHATTPLLALSLALAACGGGGGGAGTAAAPAPVTLAFPDVGATTDGESTTVHGSILLSPPITAVRVNGVAAQSSDGFATFAADVPLAPGANDFVVAVDRPGLVTKSVAFLGRVTRVDPILVEAADLVFDAKAGRILFADRVMQALVSIDPKSGARSIVSDVEHGSGPAFTSAQAVTVDAQNQFAYVLDEVLGGVIAVNLGNGDRSVLTGDGVGSGPDFASGSGLAFDAAKKRLLVTDFIASTLYAVSLANGTRAVLSDATHGAGPAFFSPLDVTVDDGGKRALVVDEGQGALFAVELATGNRTIVSDGLHGSGPPLDFPVAVEFDAALGVALVTDLFDDVIFRIDLAKGDRTIIAGGGAGSGPPIARPRAVAVDAGSDLAFVADLADADVFTLSPKDGTRDLLVPPLAVGSGPSLFEVSRLAFDPAARIAYLATPAPPAIVAVALAKGDRTTISDATHGGGPALVEPFALALDAANRRLLVTDDFDGSLVAVALANGARTLISGPTRGSGPLLDRVKEIVLDEARARVILAQSDDTMVVVDLATGDRNVFSQDPGGPLEATRMDGATLDAAHDRALVHDQAVGLFAVDLEDGLRTLVSAAVGLGGQDGGSGLALDAATGLVLLTPRSPLPPGLGAVDPADGSFAAISASGILGEGRGPALGKSVALALDATRRTTIVFDADLRALFEIDVASGDRVIVSK